MDLSISELQSIAGANLATGDLLAVADISASETKKISVVDLIGYGSALLSDATIPSAKVNFAANAIVAASIASNAVTTAKINADAVTAAKLADQSTCIVAGSTGALNAISGDFVGQLGLTTDALKLYVWQNSSWQQVEAAGSVNTITGDSTGIVNITTTVSGDTVALAATIDNTSGAAQFLAGPTGSAGSVTARTIAGTDLPTATTSAKGAVIVNGGGLTISGSTIAIDNSVSPVTNELRKVSYNAQGLITATTSVTGGDLPVATASIPGAVRPGTGLGVDVNGVLDHSNSVTGATQNGITYDNQGHITNVVALVAGDIPDLPATKLTSGTLDIARLGTNSVTGAKLANYAITKIGDTQPTADQIGQFFFNPLTRDLFLWDGNVFQPIGISVGEIVFAGTFDASAGGGTGLVDSVTAEGTAIGLTVGSALPAAAAANNRYYLVVSEAGTITTGNAPNVALSPPDIVLSNGNEWTEIDVSQTFTSVTANQVGLTPAGSISATNVQAGIEELDNEKLAKTGGTITGELLIGSGGAFAFEGSTDNTYETYLAVVDPTADRTITFPDATGTVVLSGAIVNADVASGAAIAFSKFAALSSGNVLVGNSSNVATSVAITGDISINGTGVVAIASGVIVDADISAGAEIAVSKLADGTARQLLQTAANGNDVEWASNIDIPGTLDVTGIGTFDAATRGAIAASGTVASGTTTLDFAAANHFSLTLPSGGTVTLANPSNLTAGQSGCIVITQSAGAAATVAYGSAWKFQGGAPSVSTTLSSVNVLAYFVESATRITSQLLTNTVS